MIAVRLLVCLGLIAGAVVDAIAVDVDQTTYSLNVANNVKVRVDNFNQHTVFSVLRDGAIVQSVRLDNSFGKNLTITNITDGIILNGFGQRIVVETIVSRPNFSLIRIARNLTNGFVATDCIDLDSSRLNWFGGPQQKEQYWPVQKLTLRNYAYVSKEQDNCGVTERYWLNSVGAFVYVDQDAPLFLNQNIDNNTLCLQAKAELPFDRLAKAFTFNYYIGVGADARKVHLEAVNYFLKKPTGVPDARMVRHPIWSTWARYKADINETIVLNLANEILANRFNNSQFEIDDDWEVCYGALTFSQKKFPGIQNLTRTLKAKGFRVTLWIHPFINKGCEPWYSEAKQKGYLVADHNNNTDTQWWNSQRNQAAYVDFTKPAAVAWFTGRLKVLQSLGIDSFKFDAGESSWSPLNPVLNATSAQQPNAITTDYLRTVGKFGPLVEVRSGQGTQDLPIYLRIIDKDSEWTWLNGLPTLVTTLLQLNMVGYGYVLPDMIGGNGYANRPPNKEMFIRWLQANVFMPSLQFSFVPWDFDAETINLSRNFTKLHEDYADVILERFRLAAESGQPVNPPIWWIDPEDLVAQQISDEFLLGESILAAPVLEQGAVTRHIYLPRGTWTDGNTKATIIGPKWIMNYPAPLNVLPYFIRRN